MDTPPVCGVTPSTSAHCALPWPSNVFLTEDADARNRLHVDLGADSLPANNQGVHIAPEPYKRMDGYGLSAPAIALFPNVDDSNFATEYTVEKSMEADAQILLFDDQRRDRARSLLCRP
ncbi:MAG: hypothetical protein R3E66_22550 [bacterium]